MTGGASEDRDTRERNPLFRFSEVPLPAFFPQGAKRFVALHRAGLSSSTGSMRTVDGFMRRVGAISCAR
jgi:hypothetical protein